MILFFSWDRNTEHGFISVINLRKQKKTFPIREIEDWRTRELVVNLVEADVPFSLQFMGDNYSDDILVKFYGV